MGTIGHICQECSEYAVAEFCPHFRFPHEPENTADADWFLSGGRTQPAAAVETVDRDGVTEVRKTEVYQPGM